MKTLERSDYVENFDLLLEKIKLKNEKSKKTIHSFVPIQEGSFVDSKLQFLPQTSTDTLDTLGSYFQLIDARNGGMFCAPQYWQIESRFHKTCRELGLSASGYYQQNFSVAIEVMKQAELELLFIDRQFLEKLLKDGKLNLHKNIPSLRAILAISLMYDLGGIVNNTLSTARQGALIFEEIHIVPGYPILLQDFSLIGNTETCFKLSDSYFWEFIGREVYITAMSDSDRVLPTRRFKLPFGLTPVEGPDEKSIFKVDLLHE